MALTLPPIVFLLVFGGTLGALWTAARISRSPGRGALEASSIVLLALVGILCVALAFALPSIPTISATFQTRSAIDGYLKNVGLYFMPLALMYLLVPWHAVLGLERELDQGRVGNIVGLLTHLPSAFHPPGVWFVRPIVFGLLLLPAAWIGYRGVHHMLDALAPGPYANLFTRALHIRVALWYVSALVGLWWYHQTAPRHQRARDPHPTARPRENGDMISRGAIRFRPRT